MRNTLVAFVLFIPSVAAAEADFDKWFSNSAVRVDYYHWGSAQTEEIAIDSVSIEGEWPGSLTNLTNAPDYGKYRFKVLDVASGESIFEGGYCTLFGEWQTTGEAGKVKRVFHESVRFPLPHKLFRLEIFSRNKKGKMKLVFTQEVDPGSHLVRGHAAVPETETVVMHDAGPAHTTLDVVIIADGYARAHQEKARRDLDRYAQVLLESPPFDRHKGRISVRGVITVSRRSGPDEPRKGLHPSPVSGTTFNTFDSARYLTTLDNATMRDLAATVPYDTVFIMVNSSRYGGAGIYNFFSVFVSDNEYDEYVFIHEFGHGFGGLGDEYYSSSVAYSEFYPAGVEPWEPNVTAILHGPKKVKWKEQLTPGVALPTPEEDQYAGMVGVFEGAGYAAKGLYRPALDCKMFSKKRLDFCPVCMRAVEQMIRFYTE